MTAGLGLTSPPSTTSRVETFAIIDGYRNLLLDVVVPASDAPVPVAVPMHGRDQEDADGPTSTH